MLPEKLIEILKKQHYRLAGKHSAVQICRWNKKSILGEGECYKAKFYGIKSHLCCEMSPSIGFCENRCLHCWRAIEHTVGDKMEGELDDPDAIIIESINAQQKLLSGFKGNKKVDKKKLKEAQEPMHFAISLSGEPTLYPKLGKFIGKLRKLGKTTFLVTNGLNPEAIKKLEKDRQLPTQLYVSMNAGNEKLFKKWHNSSKKDAWKRYNQSLELLKEMKNKTRTVVRMTLVRGLNMSIDNIREFAELIKKAQPDFVECKGFMSVGFSRKRLGYDMMPRHLLVREFAENLSEELRDSGYKILGEHEPSAIVLLGKDKKKMKIKKREI